MLSVRKTNPAPLSAVKTVSEPPSLSEVTLFGCVWSDDSKLTERTARVMRYCMKVARFRKAVLFSYVSPPRFDGITYRQMPKLSGISDWNIWVNRVIPQFIDTMYAMSVHEDGFIIQPELWDDRYLDYDYIGAPWKDNVVGNGGFNIESYRLLQLKMQADYCDPHRPSDYWVCRDKRQYFESNGIKFAPLVIAQQFSTEETLQTKPSFGFHGRNAAKEKYKLGWRLVEGSERSDVSTSEPDNTDQETGLNISVVYVYPVSGYEAKAKRFIASYKSKPAGIRHSLVVVTNGGPASDHTKRLFEDLSPTFFQHDNSGWDIGAYISVSKHLKCDMMLCIGADTHFSKAGWLKHFAEVWVKHGPGMYGSASSFEIRPHLNTSGFAISPKMLSSYPNRVVDRRSRYEFEWGKGAMWRRVRKAGQKVLMITADGGEWELDQWRTPPNIYRSGDQSNCWIFFSHSDEYAIASASEKLNMKLASDGLMNHNVYKLKHDIDSVSPEAFEL